MMAQIRVGSLPATLFAGFDSDSKSAGLVAQDHFKLIASLNVSPDDIRFDRLVDLKNNPPICVGRHFKSPERTSFARLVENDDLASAQVAFFLHFFDPDLDGRNFRFGRRVLRRVRRFRDCADAQ